MNAIVAGLDPVEVVEDASKLLTERDNELAKAVLDARREVQRLGLEQLRTAILAASHAAMKVAEIEAEFKQRQP